MPSILDKPPATVRELTGSFNSLKTLKIIFIENPIPSAIDLTNSFFPCDLFNPKKTPLHSAFQKGVLSPSKYGKNSNDTGSTENQIAIFTERITNITTHLKTNKKDHSGRRGLVILVSKRRRLLNYLRKNNSENYKKLINNLNIRK